MPEEPTTSPEIEEVRFLLGDTAEPFQLSDEHIGFLLEQNSNPYSAAAIGARALAARYARQVDSKFETVEGRYSQLRANYEMLARSLDSQAKRAGGALGVPMAGGISRSKDDTAKDDPDRVKPFFDMNMFNNPPPPND
jgi:hypothetical protein